MAGLGFRKFRLIGNLRRIQNVRWLKACFFLGGLGSTSNLVSRLPRSSTGVPILRFGIYGEEVRKFLPFKRGKRLSLGFFGLKVQGSGL